MPVTNNAAILEELQHLIAEQNNVFRSLTNTDLSTKIRFNDLGKAIQRKLKLIDVPLLQEQPTEAPAVVEVPTEVATTVAPLMRRTAIRPTGEVPTYQKANEAYKDLKKLLSSFIKGDDREIISINTAPQEGQLILNTFTNKQSKMLLVFTTNTTGWVLTEQEGVYSVTEIKYWKVMT